MSLDLVGVMWRSSWWLGDQEIAHTKPFIFHVASTSTCTYRHLEVDQWCSKRSPPSGLNTEEKEKELVQEISVLKENVSELKVKEIEYVKEMKLVAEKYDAIKSVNTEMKKEIEISSERSNQETRSSGKGSNDQEGSHSKESWDSTPVRSNASKNEISQGHKAEIGDLLEIAASSESKSHSTPAGSDASKNEISQGDKAEIRDLPEIAASNESKSQSIEREALRFLAIPTDVGLSRRPLRLVVCVVTYGISSGDYGGGRSY
ncbi:hypothetical protein Taro_047324 [Colocasia esculenta]|uniref:Uncharacterized protein n=1 Tax=Colocasia esculenta TaxID=4460 RepID=A0A843WSK4_COLES|nr:hypothetical protein [Colocasia esculenta]